MFTRQPGSIGVDPGFPNMINLISNILLLNVGLISCAVLSLGFTCGHCNCADCHYKLLHYETDHSITTDISETRDIVQTICLQ